MRVINKILKSLFILTFLFTITTAAFAHGGEKHPKKDTATAAGTDTSLHTAEHAANPQAVEDFPNLHPLVVHFPIVLLIVATLMQIGGLFTHSRPYHFSIAILTMIGFISGYLAASVFHAHPAELTGKAGELFEMHEQYAFWTLRIAGAAALIKVISLFVKPKKWLELITALLLVGSAICVSIAGHHGSELVYKLNIGPKGNYLEQHHH